VRRFAELASLGLLPVYATKTEEDRGKAAHREPAHQRTLGP